MNLAQDIANIELLANLDTEDISFLESVAFDLSFAAGAVLFEEDGVATAFYIIRDGKVGLELMSPRRRPMIIQTLGRNDIIGLSWLFPPYRWSWQAVALDDTNVIAFDAELVRQRCEEEMSLGNQMMRLVAREAVTRLHATRAQLSDLYESPR